MTYDSTPSRQIVLLIGQIEQELRRYEQMLWALSPANSADPTLCPSGANRPVSTSALSRK